MNPFSRPFSGVTWIEIGLALGASLVVVIYLYQVFLPILQRAIGRHPDPEERAAVLRDQYRRQKAAEEEA